MAKESSFDVVSNVDLQEVDNAYQQAARELTQRYDLKQTGSTIDFSKKDETFSVSAPSEFVCGQVIDVLNSKLAKRGIDLTALSWGDIQPATGASVRRPGHRQGHRQEDREGHPRPQAQVQGHGRGRQAPRELRLP